MEEKEYKDKLNSFLLKIFGKSDVSFIDFKEINNVTFLKNFDFKKVRGSIRLLLKRVRTAQETNQMVERFLHAKLP